MGWVDDVEDVGAIERVSELIYCRVQGLNDVGRRLCSVSYCMPLNMRSKHNQRESRPTGAR